MGRHKVNLRDINKMAEKNASGTKIMLGMGVLIVLMFIGFVVFYKAREKKIETDNLAKIEALKKITFKYSAYPVYLTKKTPKHLSRSLAETAKFINKKLGKTRVSISKMSAEQLGFHVVLHVLTNKQWNSTKKKVSVKICKVIRKIWEKRCKDNRVLGKNGKAYIVLYNQDGARIGSSTPEDPDNVFFGAKPTGVSFE